MSTGPTTQAASFQEKQSTVEHEDSHSALFYLFQEVSKLSSPTHSRHPTDQPSTQLSETKKDPLVIKGEDAESLDGSCQHGLSHMLLYSQLKKVDEEGHSRNLVESQRECRSPWKVLSLINLHCERLLHQKDLPPGSKSASSTTELSRSPPDAAEEGVRGDRVESTSAPLFKDEISSSVSPVGDVTQDCAGAGYKLQSCEIEPEVGCTVQPHTAEKMLEEDTLRAELLEDKGPMFLQVHHNEVKFSVIGQLEWKQECKKDDSSSEQDNMDTPAHMPSVCLNNYLTLHSTDEDPLPLLKPGLTLDHNANITLSAEPVQLPPPHSVPASSQSADSCHLSSKQDDNLTPNKPESPREAAQLNPSSCYASSTTSEPDILTEHKEETDVAPTRQWRAKTPRKQPRPSRSVDIQDSDFQGVSFRMDRELDDNKEQCRLLITSKYSTEFGKRKLRPRTRTSQKSLRTSSSDEENDLTINVSKGKVCASCCTRKTPMWRDAEDGTPLCNACGIRYKKYRVRCVNCWHIPRKESNTNSCCLKCGNFVRMTSAQRKHTN
ncbi:GATA-type zinc finger protein 1 [Parambassis ranga]|uniref:GATA-type zinc finger protein 1 n=1 Tax=Parambassis ranga TaxID=210632 RepID=A0A6P7IM96_9TELE|nr:GATA-type zinc finger protein 1 [Parambassis ranga]XP_028261484.1 GATA-type zinc finger protein 1 [Parambassis ranga]